MRSINSPVITEWQTISAIRLLSSLEIAKFSDVATSPAVMRLSARAKLVVAEDAIRKTQAWKLSSVQESLVRLFRDAYSETVDDPVLRLVQVTAWVYYLFMRADGKRRCALIEHKPGSALRVDQAFNLAMANWGQTGTISPEQMRRAYEAICEAEGMLGANFQQCAAIVAWAVGNKDQATKYLDAAVHLIRDLAWPDFFMLEVCLC